MAIMVLNWFLMWWNSVEQKENKIKRERKKQICVNTQSVRQKKKDKNVLIIIIYPG